MRPYYNFVDCITKMASKESLNNLSVEDLNITLYKHLRNQRVDILRIVAILMGINRDAVNAKSKRPVKKIIEKIYKDILEDAEKSEQGKKTNLIGIIYEVTTIMQKLDKKELNAPTSSEQKKVADPDERAKENIKVVNHGDEESDIQA